MGYSLLAAAMLASCFSESSTAPAFREPAQLILNASFQSTTSTNEVVQIFSSYLRQTGSTLALSEQSLKLSGQSEKVPVGINLAPCLADNQRAGSGGAAAGADECLVILEIRLLINGTQVDRQIVGPLLLRPGVVTTISNAVQLNIISSVLINAPAENMIGPGQPLRLELTRPMTLTTTVLDGQQQPVSGRSAAWTSSNSSIATVSTAGVVTGVSVGTVRIVADVGGHQSSVDVRVVPAPAALTVSAAGVSGTGTITSTPAGISCSISGSTSSGTCTSIFPGDIQVVLTATPASGAEFLSWSGDCTNAQGLSCTLSMERPRAVGAIFRAFRTLNIAVAGRGSGSVTSDSGSINCIATGGSSNGNCSAAFRDGSIVVLRALAGAQSSFTGWSGDCSEVSGSTCRVTMSAARNVTARFDNLIPISITGTGTGSGTVVSDPAGISCSLVGNSGSGTCRSSYPEGSKVTFVATPEKDNGFISWTGCTESAGTTCRVTITGSQLTIAARFVAPAVLNVMPTGSGDGQVSGGVISCTRTNFQNTGQCSATLAGASVISLSATAGAYSFFAGWIGACSGTGTCNLTMDQSQTVRAVFSRETVPLTVSLVGPGYGSVQIGSDLTCTLAQGQTSKDCNFLIDLQRSATISAAAGSGSVIESYTGSCTSNGDTCTFLVTGPSQVTVKFGIPRVTVKIDGQSGSLGTGTVYASKIDMACEISAGVPVTPSRCQKVLDMVDVPDNIEFSANPTSLSVFAGWGGACAFAGSSPFCTISNPTGTVSVSARFNPQPTVNLTMSISGVAGTIAAIGDGWYRTCNRSVFSGPATICVWAIPAGAPFDVDVSSGYTSFVIWPSTPGRLCYHSSGFICNVTSGITAPDSISLTLMSGY